MKTVVDVLILMAAVTFVIGVFLRVMGITGLMGMFPLHYWRFTIGCLAFAIALSLRDLSSRK